MNGTNDVDVFFSYDHDDRARVRPLVDEIAAHGWSVWWDTELGIGSMWRDVLTDRLDHAHAVCVVWTANSVVSSFVRDEATRANERGVLVPLRLDPVDQPLGFGELQYADLANPSLAAGEMAKVITTIGNLIDGVVPVDRWESDLGYAAINANHGVDAADWFLERVRALSDMFAANPGAAIGLQSALEGIHDTYVVVGESIDVFLAPTLGEGPATLDRYRPLADGRLVTHISRSRGHCKRIAQLYIESGGLRESLPASVGDEVRRELDQLILTMSNADMDLFDSMASIGTALQNRSAVIVNLLLGGQETEANVRLADAEAALLPVRQRLNQGMAEVERLATELGVPL